MGLWGASDTDESKPKNLTTAEKKEVFANTKGWVREAGSALSGNDNTSADEEVLVALGGLSASLGAADITEIEWITTTADKSDGFTLSARVRFNEPVAVVTTGGTPTLSATNGNQGSGSGRGPHALAYASGTGTNELVFSLAIAAANAATNADDVIVFGADPLALNSGTIKDVATSTTNATITSVAGIGTAAGGVTVTA
tara:strand:- start:190 stop:786 length:597 start_codon:yes stop_codon:yes gene_type:complete